MVRLRNSKRLFSVSFTVLLLGSSTQMTGQPPSSSAKATNLGRPKTCLGIAPAICASAPCYAGQDRRIPTVTQGMGKHAAADAALDIQPSHSRLLQGQPLAHCPFLDAPLLPMYAGLTQKGRHDVAMHYGEWHASLTKRYASSQRASSMLFLHPSLQ